MAVKNLQTVVQCAANIQGVVVTGTRKESKRAGSFLAPSFSEPSLRLAGPNPMGTDPDNGTFLRAGRSASELGVEPCARTSPHYRERKTMWVMSWMRG